MLHSSTVDGARASSCVENHALEMAQYDDDDDADNMLMMILSDQCNAFHSRRNDHVHNLDGCVALCDIATETA